MIVIKNISKNKVKFFEFQIFNEIKASFVAK